jgi:N-glycosylase/DNA lyase
MATRRAKLHILRQEPFEVLLSFVISANNHIPRIRSIIERLCRLYGSLLETSFAPAYTFPTPEALARARLEDLRLKCGLGYRDVYVQSVARTIAAQPDFAHWAALPTAELRQRLLQLDGVGEKVADCVLLFGFHRLEAFPVDTWVRRAVTELYFPGQRPRPCELQACAAKQFGAYAGIAQQYLFVNARSRL